MRILGLDIGEKTIGVAVSDPLGLTAQGLTVIRRVSKRKDADALAALVAEYEVERIVAGLPIRTDGTCGPEAAAVEKLGHYFEAKLDIPVVFCDERFTTRQAEQVLLAGDTSRKRRREVIDQVAAALILQAYLDQS